MQLNALPVSSPSPKFKAHTARTFLTVQTHHKTLHLPAYLDTCLPT